MLLAVKLSQRTSVFLTLETSRNAPSPKCMLSRRVLLSPLPDRAVVVSCATNPSPVPDASRSPSPWPLGDRHDESTWLASPTGGWRRAKGTGAWTSFPWKLLALESREREQGEGGEKTIQTHVLGACAEAAVFFTSPLSSKTGHCTSWGSPLS